MQALEMLCQKRKGDRLLISCFLFCKKRRDKSSGYSQSASLLAHNRMLLRSLSGVACTTPDTSKSQPTAYCFAQLKQGTCLIRLKNTSPVPLTCQKKCLPWGTSLRGVGSPIDIIICTINKKIHVQNS